MGQTFYFLEQYDEAIPYFEKSLAINPSFLVGHIWQADRYLLSGIWKKLFWRGVPASLRR